MILVLNTYAIPSRKLCQIDSWNTVFTGTGLLSIWKIQNITPSNKAITVTKEPDNPAYAYKKPATPGPKIEPNCQNELFQVAAFAKTSLGTRKGLSEEAAGLKKPLERPIIKITA